MLATLNSYKHFKVLELKTPSSSKKKSWGKEHTNPHKVVASFLHTDTDKSLQGADFDYTPFLFSLKRYYESKEIQNQSPDPSFLGWLIGFTEGDGYFQINKRGECALIITQGLDNLDLLKKIQQNLGFGSILKQGKRVYRLIVQKREQVKLVIQLFNGNLVLPSRKKQFQRFFDAFQKKELLRLKKKDKKELSQTPFLDAFVDPSSSTIKNESAACCYSYKQKGKNMPSLQNLWLLGFVEAEGCFSISLLSNSIAFRTRFLVSQKGDVNIPVLSHLLILFGVGRMEGHSAKENYSYIVSGLRNVFKIYPYFDKNLEHFQGIKKHSYLKFKQLNERIANKEHLDKDKRPLLLQLTKQVNNVPRKLK